MRDKLCLHRLYIRRGCLDISITTTGILFVHIYTHIKRVLEKKVWAGVGYISVRTTGMLFVHTAISNTSSQNAPR